MKILKIIAAILSLLIILFVINLIYKGKQSREMKVNPTVKFDTQTLGKCGEKPNCVSSFQSQSDDHFIAPTTLPPTLWKKVDQHFETNCELKVKGENYRHYECTTSLFGFVDDIELLYVDNTLHYRSASRVGYSDLDANRKRINKLLKIF